MKKTIISAVLLITAMSVSAFAQQTTAPDDGKSASVTITNETTPVTVTATESNVSISFGSSSSAIVTPEKEVKAATGVVYNDGKIDYASPDVRFVINARDDASGIKSISVMVDDSQFGVYEKPLAFETEGRHVAAWKVEDNVGNVSPLKFYQFILDRTGPVVSLASDKKPVMIADMAFAASNWLFNLTAQDNLSGVKEISYFIDDGATNVYGNTFSVSGSNGIHLLSFTGVDNVGNISETKNYKFFLDTAAPVTTIAVTPAAYETNGTKFISANSSVSVDAKDAESGIASIQVSIDNGDWKDYVFSFKLPSGAHTVKARSTDLLGNVSAEAVLAVSVDSDLPTGEVVPVK